MTALKLVFAVGFVLGAGALAWTAESAAKDEAVAMVKKAAALIKREGTAFARFIGEDASAQASAAELNAGRAQASSEPAGRSA